MKTCVDMHAVMCMNMCVGVVTRWALGKFRRLRFHSRFVDTGGGTGRIRIHQIPYLADNICWLVVDVGVRIDMCVHMCTDKYTDMCADMCMDTRLEMCMDMPIDICMHVCVDLWHTDLCVHMCMEMCTEIMHRHVYVHVCGHVHRHVQRDVRACVSRVLRRMPASSLTPARPLLCSLAFASSLSAATLKAASMCLHACVHACVCACVQAGVRTCMRACGRAACVRVCGRASGHQIGADHQFIVIMTLGYTNM